MADILPIPGRSRKGEDVRRGVEVVEDDEVRAREVEGTLKIPRPDEVEVEAEAADNDIELEYVGREEPEPEMSIPPTREMRSESGGKGILDRRCRFPP